jgi:hypothetical protein
MGYRKLFLAKIGHFWAFFDVFSTIYRIPENTELWDTQKVARKSGQKPSFQKPKLATLWDTKKYF